MSETKTGPVGTVKRVWARIQSRWWSRIGVDLLLILAVLWGVMAFQTRNLLPAGAVAPDFTLRDHDGGTVQLSSLRGQKVLLAFWDPWCSMCGLEAGNLQTIHDEGEVRVLSVVMSRADDASVAAFRAQHEVDYTILHDDGSVAPVYRIEALPTLYVVDEQGHISAAMAGYTTTLGIRARL